MPIKRCRACRNEEQDQPFRDISAFYAQILLDFSIKVPRFSACSSICTDCEDFLVQYDSFRKMCADSNEFFEKLEREFTADGPKNAPNKRRTETLKTQPKKTKLEDEIQVIEVVEKPPDVFEDNEEDIEFLNLESLEEDYLEVPIIVKEETEEEYYCELCQKHFSSEAHLKRHVNKVHLEMGPSRRYRCEKCDLDFPHALAVRSHRESVHKLPPGHLNCDFCDESYHKSKKSAHMKEFHENQCRYCLERFPTAGTLRIHMNTHSNLKNYMCHICEQKFFTEKTLQFHVDWHMKTKEAKYKCDECTFESNREASLVKHKRVSHAEDQFQCNKCGKVCRSKKHYESHILKHIYGPRQDRDDLITEEREVEVTVDEDSDLPDFIEVVKTPVLKPPVIKEMY